MIEEMEHVVVDIPAALAAELEAPLAERFPWSTWKI
jgi:hypothetical protein